MKIQKLVEIKVSGLGRKIEKARKKDSRSLKIICQLASISETQWRRIEAEENKALPLETLRKIEKALGVSFEIDVDN
ncbi:MAG: helix-turn-helix transcriptional regulator [Prochloraceae cyanobacterium]|nr:helix-turn-helix transcriptional regulator [Prochloraceae cyanobacterium]